MVIYKITNNINGKVYIGQTIQDVRKRWRRHCAPTSRKSLIGTALFKYKKENFTFEVIDETPTDVNELNNLEKYYIRQFNTTSPNGYNLTEGGLNYVITDELREKLSKNWHTEKRVKVLEDFKKINIGRTVTEGAKRNMSLAQTGRKHSEETKLKIKNKNLNKDIPIINSLKMALSRLNNLELNEGVRFRQDKNQYIAFMCIWGKGYSKAFAVKKFGKEEAFKLAKETRKKFENTARTFFITEINKIENNENN